MFWRTAATSCCCGVSPIDLALTSCCCPRVEGTSLTTPDIFCMNCNAFVTLLLSLQNPFWHDSFMNKQLLECCNMVSHPQQHNDGFSCESMKATPTKGWSHHHQKVAPMTRSHESRKAFTCHNNEHMGSAQKKHSGITAHGSPRCLDSSAVPCPWNFCVMLSTLLLCNCDTPKSLVKNKSLKACMLLSLCMVSVCF